MIQRTTTPEPTSAGITWDIEKDVTIYGDYFRSNSDIYTSLSIPNNVDSTYTGVIEVALQLSFYTADTSPIQQSKETIEVLPLTKAPTNAGKKN